MSQPHTDDQSDSRYTGRPAPTPRFITLDSRKVADIVRSHRDLWRALSGIESLEHVLGDLESAAHEARDALAREPEFDAIPDYVQVDSSWADMLPTCADCGKDVAWANALLMPCSTVEDGEVDMLGVVHRRGCPK